ncbi:hypothetical protein HC931_04010 [Candidatus Gracilibacteria bacterium]|nr:hypothetical protein [Candidatus Gracilibacteria bacterium]NJM87187.1 hypothetical protein [Hydrococcus sp. RU_2_2]NJP20305.1 hypothetical protein [Hydrococcus sp. CRU_1_1]
MISIPELPNVSLVAFYRTKPLAFQLLIESLQKQLSKSLQEKFESYPIEQIHATLMGCEGLKTKKGIISKWFLENRSEEKYINLSEFIDFIRQSDRLPIQIKIGGYNRAIDYGFLSKNRHPFERSFQFQGNFAVLMGWSSKNTRISLDIDRFRLECQNFNLLHKYHKQPDSIDNDCYMRIGVLKDKLSNEKIHAIEKEIRDSLVAIAPIELSIDVNSLNFIGYQNLSPSPDTTKIITLHDATAKEIERLYP